MTMDDHQNETNQDIFDDYVRRTLKGTGVEYIEEGPERILQIVENGDISMEMAVNAVAIAQAAFLMTAVYTPYDEPEWVQDAWKLRGKFGQIAESILKCFVDFLQSSQITVSEPNFRTAVVHLSLLAASPKWLWESSELTHFPDRPENNWAKDSLIVQDIDFALRRAEFFKNQEEGIDSLYRWYGEETEYYEPVFLAMYYEDKGNWLSATKWHRRYVASVIGAHVETSEKRELLDFHWAALLELCLWWIRDLPSAELPAEHPSGEDLTGDIRSYLSLTTDHSEYWAWEFGRLVATWPNRIETTDADLFYDQYESYLTAFSLLDEPPALNGQLLDPLVLGTLSAWARAYSESYFGVSEKDFAPGNVSHLSHWIAKLGYRYARKPQDASPSTPTLAPVVSPSSTVVPSDLDIETLSSGFVTQVVRDLEQRSRQERARMARETEQLLRKELTEPIWNELPDDAKGYLFQAEEALKGQDFPNQATVNYARAVECVLEDWLPAPREQQGWPGARIGEWCDVLAMY